MLIRNGVPADDVETRQFMEEMKLFVGMDDGSKDIFCSHLSVREYEAGETVFEEGENSAYAIVVQKGEFVYELYERVSTIFKESDVFGIAGIFTEKRDRGRVWTSTGGTIICIDYELFQKPEILGAEIMLNLYIRFQEYFGNLYRSGGDVFNYIDTLLIQDGGCAPGKNSIIAFLTEFLEKSGRKVFTTAKGYRSLVNGTGDDFRCLIDDPKIFAALDNIPGVIDARPLRDARGADFRSERFPEFRDHKLQKQAGDNAVKRHINMIVGIGGNGTFGGLQNLCDYLPESVQVFFVPVTIDSDVLGTETIGQHTGVEVGAEKVRCYLADAKTHHRCYFVEMMGAMGGFHALHSCVGAGAHLAVLPGHKYNLHAINKALASMDHAVIVVAEGYKKEERKAAEYKGNAAEYFRDELLNTGLKTKMRIYCEPFSRDIRGATPNNLDITLAQRMARKVAEMAAEGKSHLMPAVVGMKTGEIPFSEIRTNNSVSEEYVKVANRLY